MTTPLAQVVFVLDNSGSMVGMVPATRKAFNAYVDTLKKTKGAEIRFGLQQICKHDPTQWDAHIQDAVTLDSSNYNATGGGTPLSSSIIKVIRRVRDDLAKSGPRKVVICIQTDGQDGDGDYQSQAASEVKNAIKDGWEFVFMGADESGHESYSFKRYAAMLGIPAANVLVYHSDSGDIEKAFSDTAMNIGAFASGRAKTAAYKKG